MGNRRLVLALPCLLLAACATGGSDVPKRPPVNVADTVSSVDKALLVGTWQCHELNPVPGVPETKQEIAFKADGTLVSTGHAAMPEEASGMLGTGDMISTTTGSWQVEGGDIATSGLHTEVTSADGNALMGAMAGLVSSIANSSSATMAPGKTNVLRLGPHELVMRPVGVEDPPVLSCSR